MKQSPKIIPDRDNFRRWYLDGDHEVVLHNGDTLHIGKGYRFDGHSIPFSWLYSSKDLDIEAALVHDFLIDTSPWHRFNRAFIDKEYEYQMKQHSYGIRRWLFPKVVKAWGFLQFTLWGDYRGEYKNSVKLNVKISL